MPPLVQVANTFRQTYALAGDQEGRARLPKRSVRYFICCFC